jgi:hypothetical protein
MTDWQVKKYQFGIYKIFAYYWKGQLINLECTCMHGEIHKRNWKEGGVICKHLKEFIKSGDYKKKERVA